MSTKEEEDRKNIIHISSNIYERIRRRVAHSDEFTSIDKYIEYILTRIIDILEEQFPYKNSDTPSSHPSTLQPDEEEKIKKRLENLGYM